MKVAITDKFLWDLYNFLEPIRNNIDIFLVPRTKYGLMRRIWKEKNPIFQKYRHEMSSQRFSKLIYRLKKNNFITVENLKGKEAVMLTKKGIDKAIMSRFKFEKAKFDKRKDGKWVMIIFDIPQKHNKARNLLRSILVNQGYKMFQQSVWITPYDVNKKTEELLQFYSLDRYVRIFLIEKL